MMSIKTPLNQVRGLGSAKEGTGHFWQQRATAVALVPLSVWFLWAVPKNVGASYEAVLAWLASPVTAILLLLFIGTAFHHMKLGLQVVIEDYFHTHGTKVALLLLNSFVSYGLVAASAFAILKISLGS